MTNPLPTGTCNVPLNMHEEERDIFGRLAYRANTSRNRFMQRLLVKALELEFPDEAARIKAVRSMRGAVMLAIFCWITFAGTDIDLRRAPNKVRSHKTKWEELA